MPAEASWCSLCFARLGAAEVPAVPTTPVAPPPVAPAPTVAAPAVPAPVLPAPAVLPPHPAVAPVVETLTAPVPGVDPWVAAAIAEAPLAPTAPVVPAPVAPAAPVLPVLADPLPVPPVAYDLPTVAGAPVAPAPVAAASVAAAPVAPAAVATVEAPSWPCTACGALVDFAESACPSCHTPFMGGASPDISLKVPGVGDLVHMSSGMKFGVMAGGAAVLATVLVLLFLVLGHIF